MDKYTRRFDRIAGQHQDNGGDDFGPSAQDTAEALDDIEETVREELVGSSAPSGDDAELVGATVADRDPLARFAERMRQMSEDATAISDELKSAREDNRALIDALKIFVRSGSAALIREHRANDHAQEIVDVSVLLGDIRWAEQVYDIATGTTPSADDQLKGGESNAETTTQ